MMTAKRNGTIDFFRFVFCIVVMFFHATANYAWQYDNRMIFQSGYMGVDFFLMVSGYLMCQKSENTDATQLGTKTSVFIRHKVAALMPNVLIAWLIAFIVCHLQDHSFMTVITDLGKSVWELFFVKLAGYDGYFSNVATWYLSAMLLALAVLYPLYLKNKDLYLRVIAPLGFLFIYGYLSVTYTNLTGHTVIVGVFCKGFLKGLAGLMGGAAAYGVSIALGSLHFTKLFRTFLTIAEIALYGGSIALLYYTDFGLSDIYVVFLIWTGVIISFSNTSYLGNLLNNRFSTWLGAFSLSLYLSNDFYARALTDSQLSLAKKNMIFWGASFITAIIVMYVSKLLKHLWNKHQNAVNNLIFQFK